MGTNAFAFIPGVPITIVASPTVALGVFDDREKAAAAVRALKDAGFSDAQIAVASREWSKQLDMVDPQQQHTAERGAVGGAVVGGSLGAVVGLVGAALIPGAVPILAGQFLVGALLGGAAGAAGGAFAGPFIALGLSEKESEAHARHVEAGKTVLLIYAPDRKDEAREIMVKNGAYDESMSSTP